SRLKYGFDSRWGYRPQFDVLSAVPLYIPSFFGILRINKNATVRSLITLLEILLPVLYFGTIWAYARAFFSGVRAAENIKTRMLLVTLTIHAFYIVARTGEFHHPPITSVYEILSLISFTIVL